MVQQNIVEQLLAQGITLEQIAAAGKAATSLHKEEVQKAVEGEKVQRQTVSDDVAEMVSEVEMSKVWEAIDFTFTAKRTDTGLDDGKLVAKMPDSLMEALWEVLDTAGAKDLKSLKAISVTFKAGQKGEVTLSTSGVARVKGESVATGTRGWSQEGGQVEKLDDIFQENATDEQKESYKAAVEAKKGNEAYGVKIKVAKAAGYKKAS